MSAIAVVHGLPIRNGNTGAPLRGLRIEGAFTNAGTDAQRCGPTTFLLVGRDGSGEAPTRELCTPAATPPHARGIFSLTFSNPPAGPLTLHFTHASGRVEVAPLDTSAP